MTALELARKNLEAATRRSLPAAFLADFEIVAKHYGLSEEERRLCLSAARSNYASAAACYRAIAGTLRWREPKRTEGYSVTLDKMMLSPKQKG